MATKIAWAEEVWNPMTGCTKVSPGCKFCYAEKMANRLKGRYGYSVDKPFRVTLHMGRLLQPWEWKKPKHIFVCSMGDLFHKVVPDMFIQKVLSTIYQAPHHMFMILTKRPDTMKTFFDNCSDEWILPNVWVGTSVENQETADERIPSLLRTPAKKRFLSVEPLLGAIDLDKFLFVCADCLEERGSENCQACDEGAISGIDWVIVGAESKGARVGRECKIEWIDDIVKQCKRANIPCFVKQIHKDGKLIKEPEGYPQERMSQ